MKDFFTLQEVADWQLHNDKSQVELPSIQRGFVWKPKQYNTPLKSDQWVS